MNPWKICEQNIKPSYYDIIMSLCKQIYLLITERPIINLNVHIIDPPNHYMLATGTYVVVFGSLCWKTKFDFEMWNKSVALR